MPRGPLPVSTLPTAVLTVIAPGPPVTGACPFGCFVIPGDLSFDRAYSYSRPTGAFCHQNLKYFRSNVHRLVPAYLFGAAVVGWTSCHGFALVGGVRTV